MASSSSLSDDVVDDAEPADVPHRWNAGRDSGRDIVSADMFEPFQLKLVGSVGGCGGRKACSVSENKQPTDIYTSVSRKRLVRNKADRRDRKGGKGERQGPLLRDTRPKMQGNNENQACIVPWPGGLESPGDDTSKQSAPDVM